MKFDLHTQRYVDWKVYNVTSIKNKYGFRVKLIYADGTSTIQQKSGYTSKKAAEQARTEIIGQLYANAYVVYENILLEEFLEYWLEDVMRPKMKNSSYVAYRNSIHRHIKPHLGKVKLTKFLCETYRGTRALYIFYANCGILLPSALMIIIAKS